MYKLHDVDVTYVVDVFKQYQLCNNSADCNQLLDGNVFVTTIERCVLIQTMTYSCTAGSTRSTVLGHGCWCCSPVTSTSGMTACRVRYTCRISGLRKCTRTVYPSSTFGRCWWNRRFTFSRNRQFLTHLNFGINYVGEFRTVPHTVPCIEPHAVSHTLPLSVCILSFYKRQKILSMLHQEGHSLTTPLHTKYPLACCALSEHSGHHQLSLPLLGTLRSNDSAKSPQNSLTNE